MLLYLPLTIKLFSENPKSVHEELPEVKSYSRKVTALPNGVAELRFTATGKPEPVISWLKDNLQILPSNKFHTISNGDQFMLRITDLTAEDGGNYTLLAVNNAGTGQDAVNLEITTKATSRFVIPLENTNSILLQ